MQILKILIGVIKLFAYIMTNCLYAMHTQGSQNFKFFWMVLFMNGKIQLGIFPTGFFYYKPLTGLSILCCKIGTVQQPGGLRSGL